MRESSSGKTLYFAASIIHSCCMSRSLSGIWEARSLDCVQSLLRSYSSHLNPFITSLVAPVIVRTHGVITGGAEAIQSS